MRGNGLYETRKLLYNLKRRFGQRIEIKKVTGRNVNVRTGKVITAYETLIVKKAVVLPEMQDRIFSYHLAFIAANRNFTYGGLFDESKRTVLIDLKDIAKDKTIIIDDRVLFKGNYWDVKNIVLLDDNTGMVLTIEHVGVVNDE